MRNVIDTETFHRIQSMLDSGEPNYILIAERVGVSTVTVARIAEGTHILQTGKSRGGGAKRKPALPKREKPSAKGQQIRYLPTPNEIAVACELIQAARLLHRSDDDEDCVSGWMPPIYSERTLAVI